VETSSGPGREKLFRFQFPTLVQPSRGTNPHVSPSFTGTIKLVRGRSVEKDLQMTQLFVVTVDW
jgi:hypothetical protein